MSEPSQDVCFRIATASGRPVAEQVRARLVDRLARGVILPEEVSRISQMKLHTLSATGIASEAFRKSCVSWEIDRPPPVTSHRPLLGPWIVAAKKILRRVVRWPLQPFLARQRDFNRSLLVVLRDLLERLERERTR
jgi:hypothetical protein